MPWNADKPAMADQIGDDVPDIEENFQYVYDLFTVQNIWVPASAMTPVAASPAAFGTYEHVTYNINLDYYAFDGATEEYVAFPIVMPDNWNRGTLKAKFYWSSATGSTAGDTCEWEICAVALSDSDVIDVDKGTSQVISDTLLATNGTDLQISGATPALTVGGSPALGDLIYFQVSRNVGGTDDMTEDAWLFGMMLQITVNQSVTAW